MDQRQRRYFYILGFPRSRSTWFSQFLSTNVSRCYHEILSSNDIKAFEKYMNYYDSMYVGSADTNPISLSKTPRKPGPMVLVYRKPSDVKKSLRKAFDRHEGFTASEWDKYIINMVDMYDICLDWYKQNEKNLLYVPFEDLEDDQVVMRVFKHCIPAFDPDWSYIRSMQNLRITVKNKKGLRNGIEATLKNVGKNIKQFKDDHIKGFDKDKFRETFFANMEHRFYEEPEPSRIILTTN